MVYNVLMIRFTDIPNTGFKGFRVFGDVHGEFENLLEVVKGAFDENLFPIGLGDFTDRGPDSDKVMAYVLWLTRNGLGATILGNHDDKLWRALNGNKVKINHGLELTLEQLDANPDREGLANEWQTTMPDMPLFATFDKYTFVHGAFHPSMLTVDELAYKDKKGWGKVISLAMYGQVDGFLEDGYPNRIHDWVDTIPEGHTVFVGHEVVGDVPLTEVGALGGTAHFLDTGSAKGGKMSFMDVEF